MHLAPFDITCTISTNDLLTCEYWTWLVRLDECDRISDITL